LEDGLRYVGLGRDVVNLCGFADVSVVLKKPYLGIIFVLVGVEGVGTVVIHAGFLRFVICIMFLPELTSVFQNES